MSEDLSIRPREGPGSALPAADRAVAALVDASPLAVVAFDPEGVVTSWNPAAARIFGWSAEEAIGARLPFVQAEKQLEFRAICARALSGESFDEPELHRRRADGSPIVVRARFSPIRRADGSIHGILSILADAAVPGTDGDGEGMREIARKVLESAEPA